MGMLRVLNLGRSGEDGARICPKRRTSDVLETLELRCIQNVGLEGVVDPKILACVIAYEIVHQFGPKTGYFLPYSGLVFISFGGLIC